jgi:hypothetical protein
LAFYLDISLVHAPRVTHRPGVGTNDSHRLPRARKKKQIPYLIQIGQAKVLDKDGKLERYAFRVE